MKLTLAENDRAESVDIGPFLPVIGVKAGLGDLLVGGYNGGTEVRVVLCGEFERDEIVFAGVHREAGRPDLRVIRWKQHSGVCPPVLYRLVR